MKIDKKKIVFITVLVSIILFIAGYSMTIMGDDNESIIENNDIAIPDLPDDQKEYETKLEAVNDLKEVRETNAPSIYDEHLLDSTGVYDSELLSKEKMRMVDSIYNEGRISYSEGNYRSAVNQEQKEEKSVDTISEKIVVDYETMAKELALEHQLFFASNPVVNDKQTLKTTDAFIYAKVDGTQSVRNNFRLRMRLTQAARIDNHVYPKNTTIYGFVSFKPNRTIIKIQNINHHPVKLKAFDLEDGTEGVYIENSFHAEARQEVVADIVEDINITGVPQVGGIKKIFQRGNRAVKVTIADNYQLILKP
ncbi:conjugative transposon protein TraM [Pseudotamlana carrageenivorans]|uniref:Conjugal transfer protein TraM n=1 Tax=Pseudotamlana carrageenivorans TaxID=2069432 RepID=A0A2I7SK58_9FLAO|nr:conjugative transposon protein TraM [Tamlana carrageenivorans]AUS06267.1 conjugal transfer protein TraM [Tamlana carrageenivorans]